MLPVLDRTSVAVAALGGVRSHLSAALHHGWEVAAPPALPMVTIPRDRHRSGRGTEGVRLFWGRPTREELTAGVTSPVRTVVDCARVLPFEEALAVADSALRAGTVTRAELRSTAAGAPRTGRRRAVEIAGAADGRSANVFESLLRAITIGVPGLQAEPQVHIGGAAFIGAADLVDVRLGIVIEAESWAYHGGRTAFDRDVRRYTAMVSAGWVVLRFLWQDVRHHPDDVRAVLTDVVRHQRRG